MLYTKTINKNKLFIMLYKKGKCIISKSIVIYAKPNNLPYNRLGITVGKKVGNAVKRNRAKRIIRQAYMENEILMPIGIDIVIVARASITKVKSTAISKYLSQKGILEIKKSINEAYKK